ncbi:MAG: phosphomannomutase/phosphoglucomutase [Candidatus Thermoplasmatota archaeon]|nr:phosphomannomutase/phosphoglucomutase [Candidatus Thermoplasmatota archaeon]
MGVQWAIETFKAYDIRGIAGSQLTPAFAERLGRALPTFLNCDSIAVGRDIRESGPELHGAFVSGLLSSGCNVHDLGICTTGALYSATANLDVDGGVMITASHNPPEYNGFKMCRGTAAMAGEEIQELRAVFEEGQFRSGDGQLIDASHYLEQYMTEVVNKAGTPSRQVKLAIDCANAVPGPFMVDLCEKLGCEVFALHCDWDNSFPNHPPDPTRAKNMVQLGAKVREVGAEFGIGVDGDGDRIGVVDENGNFIHPDRLLAVFARDVLSRVPENATDAARTIIHDVKCSMALEQTITNSGGIPHMMRTGHSFLKQALRENPEVPLAGEMSGHFFFHDRWNGFDDSLYATARLIELVSRGGESFSQLFDGIPTFPSTGEAKVPLIDDRNETMAAVKKAYSDMEYSTVDGVRVRYSNGWYLCRPSNTEPILVMRAEAGSQQDLDAIKQDVERRIGGFIELQNFQNA